MNNLFWLVVLYAVTDDVQADDAFIETNIIIASKGSSVQLTLSDMCLTACISSGNCQAFLYNETTGDCSLGSWFVEPQTPNEVLFTGNLWHIGDPPCANAKANFTLKQNGPISTCLWISNFTTDYTSASDYCQDQPDNYQNEDCVLYSASSGAFNDIPCSSKMRFACEFSPML